MGDSHPGWYHETRGIDHLMQWTTQGASITRVWRIEEKTYEKMNMKETDSRTPKQLLWAIWSPAMTCINHRVGLFWISTRKRNIYILWGGGSLGSFVGGQEASVCFILVLLEYIWNLSAVSLVLPAFDDTGSVGNPPCRVVYHHGSTLGDSLPFHCNK